MHLIRARRQFLAEAIALGRLPAMASCRVAVFIFTALRESHEIAWDICYLIASYG